MSSEDIMKDVILETTKQVAVDVYKDTTHPTAKNIGGFFGTLSGFFNHVVMYPLKKLNIKYEQKAIAFEKAMEKKFNAIPENDRVEPQLHIVGPTMESLKYSIMEDDIAEMYSNLLLSDMDNKTQSLCSPAFIKIIEQLSPIDARVYKSIIDMLKQKNALPICSINFIKKSAPQLFYTIQLPKYYTEKCEKMDDFAFSASLVNLNRLGLLNFSFTQWLADDNRYAALLQSESIKERLLFLKTKNDGDVDTHIFNKGMIQDNDFSRAFARVCFREGDVGEK